MGDVDMAKLIERIDRLRTDSESLPPGKWWDVLSAVLVDCRSALLAAARDAERLEELERMARERPFMLHDTAGSHEWPQAPFGLGLQGGDALRTALAQQAAKHEAELAALWEEIGRCNEREAALWEEIGRCNEREAAMEAEAGALQRDSERLDWLISEAFVACSPDDVRQQMIQFAWSGDCRVAIDRDRAAAKEPSDG